MGNKGGSGAVTVEVEEWLDGKMDRYISGWMGR